MKDKLWRATWLYTAALILLGLIGYIATDMQSITALIPAFFGIVVLGVSLLLRRSARPSIAAWSLVIIAAIGLLATIMGVPKAVGLVMGQETARPAAAISQTVMALFSLVYGAIMVTMARRLGSAK